MFLLLIFKYSIPEDAQISVETLAFKLFNFLLFDREITDFFNYSANLDKQILIS